MSEISRRKLIKIGLWGTAGVSGLAVAANLAEHYGLIPPDAGVLYGAGETLTYAAQQLLARHSLAREFAARFRKIRSQTKSNPWVRSSSAFRTEHLWTGALPLMAWSPARCRSRLQS
jgi:hypothetical protein